MTSKDIENVKKMLDNNMLSDEIKSSLSSLLNKLDKPKTDNKEFSDYCEEYGKKNQDALYDYGTNLKNIIKFYFTDLFCLIYEISFNFSNNSIQSIKSINYDNKLGNFDIELKNTKKLSDLWLILSDCKGQYATTACDFFSGEENNIQKIIKSFRKMIRPTKGDVLTKINELNCNEIYRGTTVGIFQLFFYAENHGSPIIMKKCFKFNDKYLKNIFSIKHEITKEEPQILKSYIYDSFNTDAKNPSIKNIEVDNIMASFIVRNNEPRAIPFGW